MTDVTRRWLVTWSGHVTALIYVMHVLIHCTGAKEYCQLEGFDATCPPGHVILITKAKYGRMKLGRCLTRDYYVGCSDDVTNILHERCSGKASCFVSLPDPALYEKQHCPKDLVSYLDAEYSCLQVTHLSNITCLNNERHLSITQSGGFIAGYEPFSSYSSNPVASNCHLVLRASRGQTINITLYEFSSNLDTTFRERQGQYQCVVLATIRERIAEAYRENVVCSHGDHTQQLVYSSKTHEIRIDMNQLTETGNTERRFLLQYQAVGCRDPDIPVDMTQQRRGDQLDVRCNNTGQVWHLVCRGNGWVGEFGNCTTDAGGMYYEGGSSRRSIGFPNAGIVMAIVVGIVLGIMIGFCLLLVVYNVRRKRKKAAGARTSGLDRTGSQLTSKYPDAAYNVSDPMLPGNHARPDLTAEKGCHVVCDVSGTMLRGRDHVYEKPQTGVEVQCLLSPTSAAEPGQPVVTRDAVDCGDYTCHLHRQTTWSQRGERLEMIPPPPSCIIQT